MATVTPTTFENPKIFHHKIQQPNRSTTSTRPVGVGVGSNNAPFDIETTLTFEAIQYWAKVDPHRTALITTPKQWKVDHGKLVEKHDIHHDVEWTTITYGEFWNKVNRMRAALHQAGIPVLQNSTTKPVRLLLLYAPTNRADVLALLMALQATGCTLLFGTPDAFGGIRNFMETMLQLKPDYVIANKMIYTIFRGICMTLSGRHKQPTWIKSTVFTKIAPKLTAKEIEHYTRFSSKVTLDSVTTIMFSSGTTGPPTPIEISQRMLSFQAAGYAQLLQKHLGQGIIRQHTTITGSLRQDNDSVLCTKRDGPWISTHIFVNFVMLDLVLGGTAVMQPMGLSNPDKTVDAPTLLAIWDKFQGQVTSAPPALWRRVLKLKQQQQPQHSHSGGLDSLRMAFIGGAETSTTFANQLAKEFFPSSSSSEEERSIPNGGCGLYRVYGTTQVLPIAMASDWDIRQETETSQTNLCARGYGVCLGTKADGLQVTIDTKAWKDRGGRAYLTPYRTNNNNNLLKLGELCAIGKAVSPSMEEVVVRENNKTTTTTTTTSNDSVPTRIFRSGDICYVDPTTQYIYFLGRMAQAVDCGGGDTTGTLGLVPPVGVEMVCLETGVVDRCAFVGVPHHHHRSGRASSTTIRPTLVVQFENNNNNNYDGEINSNNNDNKKEQVEAACRAIRTALEKSIWAPILNKTELALIVYSKTWPVDARHSSKTNRFQLRDWAAKADQHKLFSI